MKSLYTHDFGEKQKTKQKKYNHTLKQKEICINMIWLELNS
jgi:hypothetical protein